MTAIGLRGGELRERRHLDPFVKDGIAQQTGVRPVSRKLSTQTSPGWAQSISSSLGHAR